MKYITSILFKRSKIAVITLVLFIIGLLVGLFFSFPQTKIKQQIISSFEKQGHVLVKQGDVQIGLLGIEGVQFLIQPENLSLPAIPIDSFIISPQWMTLISKNPGIRLEMKSFGGDVSADVFRDGTLKALASQLDLSLILPEKQTVKLSGQLETMTLESTVPLQKSSPTVLELVFKNVSFQGENPFPFSLNLGDVVLNGTGRGRSFEITSLRAVNGDLNLDGNGTFILARNFSSSRIKMKINIRPENQLDPTLLELLNLGARQAPDGSYDINLSGILRELLPGF